MAPTKTLVSTAKHLKLYLFLSALALNLFVEIITIANWLSIQYFFHTIPMTIRIDFLSGFGNTLLWVGSLYIVYITRETSEQITQFQHFNRFLNMALIGSGFLLLSVLLATIGPEAEPSTEIYFNQLQLFFASFGYILSFVANSLAILMVMVGNRRLQTLFLTYFFSLLIPIEIWSLIHWLAYPFDIVSYLGFAWRGAFMELQLFYIGYPLIFWLLIAFLFSWIWVPLAKLAISRITSKRKISVETFSLGSISNTEPQTSTANEDFSKNRSEHLHSSTRRLAIVAVLSVSVFLGVFIAYYTYINPEPGLVGTDSLGYYYSLNAMVGKDFFEAAQLAAKINSARVLYHLSLYVFQSLTQLPSNIIIEFIPVFTIIANTLAVFWFVRVGEKKALVASLAAILSIFSFNTTIAIQAGLYANWLAMALGFTMFGLILKFHKRKSLRLLFAIVSASAIVFFIHYWSLVFFLLVSGCYIFLTFLERVAHKAKLASLMMLFASAIIITLFLGGFITRFFISYGSAENVSPTDTFVLFWNRLPILIDSWFFGALANPVLIALSIVGIVGCFYQKTNFSRLLISWTIIGSLLSVLVSPVGTNMNQWLTWRTLYLIPFQIPAALGLFFLAAKLGSFSRNSVHSDEGKHGNYVQVKPSISLPMNNNIGIIFLIIDYVISALLLTLDFPILLALVLFNFLVLTFVFHFRVFEANTDSFLVFIFVLFVTLALFDYTLRTLAPLAVQRMQI